MTKYPSMKKLKNMSDKDLLKYIEKLTGKPVKTSLK
jgi:hypothetical protein